MSATPALARVAAYPADWRSICRVPDRVGGQVRPHEPEERFEVALSVANQAAAFDRVSRSSLSRRFSRRSRLSSSRSLVVRPPSLAQAVGGRLGELELLSTEQSESMLAERMNRMFKKSVVQSTEVIAPQITVTARVLARWQFLSAAAAK